MAIVFILELSRCSITKMLFSMQNIIIFYVIGEDCRIDSIDFKNIVFSKNMYFIIIILFNVWINTFHDSKIQHFSKNIYGALKENRDL